ncbi:hypothetical protein OPV22_031222 [Ensete ventricosum]|uniref:Secreted protein n=1 Tax=Ensete ventricosum TaxID=4639 RepID=A0AAV8PKE7_ENSVE|nr:hypothetical protein OPV22_031222 [Ensete ventricosum]
MGSDPLLTLRLLILLGSTGDGSAAAFLVASRLTTPPVWENNPMHTRSIRRRSLRVQIPIGPPVSHRDGRRKEHRK